MGVGVGVGVGAGVGVGVGVGMGGLSGKMGEQGEAASETLLETLQGGLGGTKAEAALVPTQTKSAQSNHHSKVWTTAARVRATSGTGSARLVGRQPQFHALMAALAAMQAGKQLPVAVVEGGHGQGKSTLLREFRWHVLHNGGHNGSQAGSSFVSTPDSNFNSASGAKLVRRASSPLPLTPPPPPPLNTLTSASAGTSVNPTAADAHIITHTPTVLFASAEPCAQHVPYFCWRELFAHLLGLRW